MSASGTAAAAATTRSRHSHLVQREFVFVPFGGSASHAQDKSSTPDAEPRPTISCDGRVSDVTMELTHWTNNQTPDRLYADTSTGMALNLAQAVNDPEYASLKDALVLNNHYDTDGLASTFSCLEPELALDHRALLLSAAEAGDFGEWNSNAGVQLDLALEAWLEQHPSKDEETAYHSALQMLPDMLQDFQTHQGENFEYLWKDAWNQVVGDYEYLTNNEKNNMDHLTIAPAAACPKDMAIILEPPSSTTSLSSLAIYRAMRESGHWPDQMGIAGGGPIRILRAKTSTTTISSANDSAGAAAAASQSFSYQYEMIGHGWVQRLVQRRPCAQVPNVEELVQELNRQFKDPNSNVNIWKKGGVSGLVSICQTTEPVHVAPQNMAFRLAKLDPVLAALVAKATASGQAVQ